MRALVCKAFGVPGTRPPELALEDIPPPQPAADEVVVQIRAASANFPDLLMLDDRYQHRPTLPFVPGYEFAGVVKSVGAGVTGIAPGDTGVAITRSGAFAEQAAVKADRFWKLPAPIDMRHAAAFPLAYGTSYHALKDRARLQPGETLLVLGAAGGVGLAGVQIGKLMGARVIACASSAAKLETCRAHGADELIDYGTEDLRGAIRRVTGGRGVDVVLDPVGGPYSEAALRSLAWDGRLLVVGFTAGEIPRIPLNLPLLKGAWIVGVSWDTFSRRFPEAGARNVADMARWIADGRLVPAIGAEYPLERAELALRDIRERRVQGKVVVVT
ncbi:NADPH:quinone oxidoreductase family protein [Pigmentiphaga soli]|uniref:NADPH:quinone oxidoreductase family protein n=1 Tax=Pigmentiphaga soli TaxID=1007095 RepID=A0ABP8GEV3_9BURK